MADQGVLGEPITIRFDGLDAERHELELIGLSDALSGLSKIISASSHFALTQEVALRRDRQQVRVVARPPRDGCFIIDAYVLFSHHHPMFKDYSVATLGGLTVTSIGYIIAKAIGNKEEMKLLAASLETAIHELGTRDQKTIDRLLGTVDKMADSLRPAVKQAVSPIGDSARTLTIGMASASKPTVIDEADKAAILSPAGLSVDEERGYLVLISELDMQTGSCHVDVEGDDAGRHSAKITDPECSLPNNVYVLAMAAKEAITVRAKATFRDGQIERLFISNHDGRRRGEPDYALEHED